MQSIRTAPNEKHVHVPLRTYTCGLPEPPIDAAQDAVGSQLAAARVAHTAARQAERVASAAATPVREEEGQGNPLPDIPPCAALKEEGISHPCQPALSQAGGVLPCHVPVLISLANALR